MGPTNDLSDVRVSSIELVVDAGSVGDHLSIEAAEQIDGYAVIVCCATRCS
jgi:hypothetical protein